MALPDIIEIVPPRLPLSARIAVPGSKSITNRALILAALQDGETVLKGALWSEDTQVMVECLRELGFMINVDPDKLEPSNRTITVYGRSQIPRGGTIEQPLNLFVGNAGTAARFLTAFVCLGQGVFRLQGVARMHQRPQSELFNALRQLGYVIQANNECLPAIIHSQGARPGKCRVSMKSSSQFASALLLVADVAGWDVEVDDENEDEAPYVIMTRELVKSFPKGGGTFEVEPDASSASYFTAAGYLLSKGAGGGGGAITLASAPHSNWQIDARFKEFLPLPANVSRQRDLGDSILTAMVVAPFSSHPVKFTELGRLRVQECERVAAMKTELSKCGVRVVEEGDSLTIYPCDELHGAAIDTYGDHRISMCFAVLGLVIPGMRIKDPSCVKKTFPNFFEKLALPTPEGLGTLVLDGRTGAICNPSTLSAE